MSKIIDESCKAEIKQKKENFKFRFHIEKRIMLY